MMPCAVPSVVGHPQAAVRLTDRVEAERLELGPQRGPVHGVERRSTGPAAGRLSSSGVPMMAIRP